jgi:pSer/pThr/pTyr-binding forkhead associated (FHA) protein
MADRVTATPLQTPRELKEQLESERAGLPFLIYRDGEERQHILPLSDERDRVTVGRDSSSDIWIDWDKEVSRLHAELTRFGQDWIISDDGLSRNGTHVNGQRVVGRRRLRDGDVVRFGHTTAVFREPMRVDATETRIASEVLDRASLSEAQRRVLLALCRPFKEASGYVTPATNQQIAAELFLSVDAVKTHLRALFAKFGIEQLPQNQKRVRLVELALKSGVVSPRDL